MPLMKRFRVVVGELLGEIDRLVDRDDRRDVVAVLHLEDGEPEDGEVDLGDAVELPVVSEGPDVSVDLGHVLDRSMDQLLAEGVVLTWILLALEEDTQVLGQVHRGIDAPGKQILEGGDAAVAALGELSFAHRRGEGRKNVGTRKRITGAGGGGGRPFRGRLRRIPRRD
jgi:hypothetical protein